MKRFIYIFVVLFTIMSIGRVAVFAQMVSADTAVSVSEDGKAEASADSKPSEAQSRTDKETSDSSAPAADKRAEEQPDKPVVKEGEKLFTYSDAETGKEENLIIKEGKKVNILPSVGKYNGVAGNSVIFVKEDKKISDATAPEGKIFTGWKAEKTQGEYVYTLTAQYKDASGSTKKEAESEPSDEYDNEQDERIQNTSEGDFFDKYPAFAGSKTIGNTTVMVTAENGVFPAGSSLYVAQVSKEDREKTLKAVGDIRKDDAANIRSRTFDIKILDAEGNEIQPVPGKKVNVTFDTKDVADKEHVTRIYHTEDDTFVTRELQVKTQGTAATAETSGFSYYTVEFTYNEKQYVLEGDDVVKLSDILSHVGISGEVSSWEVSAPQLFNIFMGDEEGIDYTYDDETEIPANKEGGTIPYMAALKPFKTNEWLKVTVGGLEYTIDVTDNWNGNTYVPIDTQNFPRVIQGGNEDNFTSDMPVATIWVDDSKIDMNLWKQGKNDKLTWTIKNAAIHVDGHNNVNTLNQNTNTKQIWKGGGDANTNTEETAWGQSYVDFTELTPEANNSFLYKLSGDLIEYKMIDGAEIFDPNTNSYKKLDIVITYSNLELAIENDIGTRVSDLGYLQLFDFNKVYPEIYPAAGVTNLTSNSRVGVQFDVNIKVVDKDSNKVDGSFYLPLVDADVARTGSHFKQLGGTTNASNNDNYSEAVALLSNYGAPKADGTWEEKFWIPGADFDPSQPTDEKDNMPYISNIKDESGKPLKITSYGAYTYKKVANPQDPANGENKAKRDNDYYSGGATLANNTAGGANLRMWGTSSPQGGVLMFILGGSERINYKVAASTDVGGSIATTTAGNMQGDLTGGDVIAADGINTPKISAAAPGQTIKYTMTPKPGYKIKNVYVSTVNHTVLADVQDPNVTVQPIDLASDPNVSYSGSGEYVYSFSDIDSDKSIHVEWESTKLKVTKAIESTGWEVGDTFTFNIRIWDPETHNDKFRVRAYKTQTTSAYNFVRYPSDMIAGDDQEYYVCIEENGNYYFLGWDSVTNTFVRQIHTPVNPIAANNFDAGSSYKWKLTNDKYLYNVGAGEYIRAYKTGFEDAEHPTVGGAGAHLEFNTRHWQYDANSDRKLYCFTASSFKRGNMDFYKTEETNTTANIYYNIKTNPSNYSLNSGYEEIIGEAGTYKIELPQGQTPDVTALRNAGYTVDVSKIASEEYDMETALQSFGATLVPGTTDTYSFTLTNGDSVEFDAVIPAGWSYTITEVGEDDTDLTNDIPGTKPGWQFVSKTDNASMTSFDGDEDVTFTNKRLPKELKVTKIWDDENNAYETRPSDYVNTLNFNVKTQETQGSSNVERTYNSINDAVSKTETPSDSGRVEYVFHTRWDEKITDITETVPTGYDVSYNIPTDGESGEITNSLKYFDITINKTAVDSSADANPADGIFTYKVKVYRETSQGREYRDLSEYPNYLTSADDDAYELTISTEDGTGTGKVLRIPYGFKYEITENERFGWRLLNVDGDSDKTSATGQVFADATHTFENTLKTHDLTITKNTENNATGTFKIKLKVTMPETRTRTIHYLDYEGNKLAPDTVQVVTFLPTDSSTYTVSGSWSEVVPPDISGYIKDDYSLVFEARDMTGATPATVNSEDRYVYYR